MISDCRILGIEETDDVSLIKKAYRARVKQLHPDTADDVQSIANHYLFVEVCKAYRRLVEKQKALPERKPETKRMPGDGKAIAVHADPAYAYYKNGMTILKRIHPSEWKVGEKAVIATEIGDDEESQREARQKVMDLVGLFPKAYYCFSVVANDYPESVWASDAMEKMGLIEGRMKRYKSILASFSSWKEYRNREEARYRKAVKGTKCTCEEPRHGERKERNAES
jgi:curved DNA-binding protein CbpA